MSWFTNFRDTLESAASVVGNYFLPGSGLVTSQLVSSGAQDQLHSPLGQLSMIGSGVGGGLNNQFGNYGTLGSAISTGGIGGVGDWASNLWSGGGGMAGGAGGGTSSMFNAPDTFNAPGMTSGTNPLDPEYLKKLQLLSGMPGATPFDISGAAGGMYGAAAPTAGGAAAAGGGLTQLPLGGLSGTAQGSGIGLQNATPSGLGYQGTAGGGLGMTPTSSTGGMLSGGAAEAANAGGYVPGTVAGGVPAAAGSSQGFMSQFGNLMPSAKNLGTLASVGSGLYGLSNAAAMRGMAGNAMNRADPWGASGGRAGADAQLQSLLRDPTGAAQNDPAFKLRMQAAMRANAPMGTNSGAMATAAANASTDWYNNRLSQLGGISGANVNPAQAQQLGLEGTGMANTLAGNSLASIGFGINNATGGSAGSNMPPSVRTWLASQGIAVPS